MNIKNLVKSKDFRLFWALVNCCVNAGLFALAWWDIVHSNPVAAIAVAGMVIVNVIAAVCLFGVEKAEPLASAIGGKP